MVCEAKSYKHLGFAMSTSLGLMAHPFIRNRIIDVSQHVELKESTFRALLRLPGSIGFLGGIQIDLIPNLGMWGMLVGD